MERIWNPQTTGQKLASRFFLPVGLRDNATRAQRTRLSIAISALAIAWYLQYRVIQEQKAELAREHKDCIRMPKFDFKFTMPKF